MSATTASDRSERPPYVWAGIGLEIFVAVMAVPVGLVMIVDPNGSPVGIPHDWIANSGFGSYLVPGIFLFAVNGIGELFAAGLAVRRHWLAPWMMGGLGVALMIWIAVQVLIIPLSFLQPTIFVIGAAQGLIALFWLMRHREVRYA